MIILNAWTTSGTIMLFYLASLQSIRNEIYEAAAIDGAGWWQTFRRITFPLLGRATSSSPRSRSSARSSCSTRRSSPAAPDGEPNNSLMTIVLYLYNAAFAKFDFGLRGGRRHRPVRDHLHGHARPARLFGQAPAW